MSREKSIKTFSEDFGYYDRTGMQEYLEQKASEGWRLVKKQFAREWEFRRIEPQKLHYAITYLPQFSNEDSFLLSKDKNEYLELCAASGWQFVCAYKNMVIFINEQENPLPLETDPEAELATIHKSFLKHDLPKSILSFVFFMISFFYMLFSDTASESADLVLCFFSFLSFYTAIDFFSYLRWRKKALAAAATGEFRRTGIPDKFLSALLYVFLVLCVAIILMKSIIMSEWETTIVIAVIAVMVIINEILDKLKKKTEANWKKNLFKFVSFLIYIAAVFFANYILDLF